jgi:2'-5' RNA ligase
VASGAPGAFASTALLRNHWSGPARPRAYYWYILFDGATEARALAARCQQAIAFPYYDQVPPPGLHMTLDRIGTEAGVTTAQLRSIEAAARRACQAIPPFRIALGPVEGSPGAVGFMAAPVGRIHQLRDALRAATLSACPDAPVMREAPPPHVTIAYANTDDVPAADAIAAVGKLNAAAPRAEAAVAEATLVLLERRQRAYAWQPVARIPLAGPRGEARA